MNVALKVAYLWHDHDVIEVRVQVENVEFRGTADVYVGAGELLEAAALLEGFPSDNLDKREVVFGATGKEFTGGFVRLEFYCRDGAGHAAFCATIEGDYGHRDSTETAIVHVSFEPAALDAFLLQLRQVEKDHSGSASLMTAP
ncbi:MAG TPA: hypothetical protein VK638_26050 [Edaphobacter sp.]|nr:hypothetical protein [Edaphobacter sp.]